MDTEFWNIPPALPESPGQAPCLLDHKHLCRVVFLPRISSTSHSHVNCGSPNKIHFQKKPKSICLWISKLYIRVIYATLQATFSSRQPECHESKTGPNPTHQPWGVPLTLGLNLHRKAAATQCGINLTKTSHVSMFEPHAYKKDRPTNLRHSLT